MVGQVNSPGLYKYTGKQRINDAIKMAGGFNENSNKTEIFIKYPNGVSKKYSRIFGNHKVTDGSIISIGRKPEQEPFDKTEYAKEITSILSNLAQALSFFLLMRSS